MLEELETIPWDELHHAYGRAKDVPLLLRDLTSANQGIHANALRVLFGNIYHQGARWEASSYTIRFLAELAASPLNEEARRSILTLLLRVALGDAWLDDKTLPFDPSAEFALANGLRAIDLRPYTLALYEESTDPKVDEDIQIQLTSAWNRDCYQECAIRLPLFKALSNEGAEGLATLAVSALPWFPAWHAEAFSILHGTLARENCPTLQATAAITLSLLPKGVVLDTQAEALLRPLIERPQPVTLRLACASALVAQLTFDAPTSAIDLLIDAETILNNQRISVGETPFNRPLMGYRAQALYSVGLPP